jgi:hypothetical protein
MDTKFCNFHNLALRPLELRFQVMIKNNSHSNFAARCFQHASSLVCCHPAGSNNNLLAFHALLVMSDASSTRFAMLSWLSADQKSRSDVTALL